MGETSLNLFIGFISTILLVLTAGIVSFIVHYHKRKLLNEREKQTTLAAHKLELLGAQLEVQTQTMQFIGREIHDSVAQKITLVSIYTQQLEFENKYPSISPRLHAVSRIINDSLAELRALSKNLTDAKLQHATLDELIEQECALVSSAGICAVNKTGSFDGSISIPVKSYLLRIVQEFLQNSLKHAGCRHIMVITNATAGGLELVMTDDGKGFDTRAVQAGGIGLHNIKRRMQLIGGTHAFTSSSGEGTRLSVFVPADLLTNSSL